VNGPKRRTFAGIAWLVPCAAIPLANCSATGGAELARPQDSRQYVAPIESEFSQLPGSRPTYRWVGVLDGAAYRIEVPQSGWNGSLVMWTHGYLGNVPKLKVGDPLMRQHLIERGYAWAASSYSKNGYDARAGIEDTNQLALAFVELAHARKVILPAPKQYLIVGISMGGHIAAAAVERETLADERHKVHYAGALPMCGVVGDTRLQNYFAAYHLAAMQLAGRPVQAFPIQDWNALKPMIQAALWTNFPAQTTDAGERLKSIYMNLSGGARPFFAEGYADPSLEGNLWSVGGRDGTFDGVLLASMVDTRQIVYRFGTAPGPLSNEELAFNASIVRAVPEPDANRRRRDGLRWVPQVQGDFKVPVLTLHTLGDIYVPIVMEQIYRARAQSHHRDGILVQRVIRDIGHCAFTEAEADEAFDDLTAWVAGGPRPQGDDVAPAALAAPSSGCRFTRNRSGPYDYTDPKRRAQIQAHYPPCQS
jgi:pimeloyl-ACP methyl ester carboxylesterase